MSIPWSVPIFLTVAAVLIVVYALGSRLFTRTVTARRSFWCPFRQRNVTADFSESGWDERAIDVQACDAFTPPTGVACDKACLGLRRLPGTKPQPAQSPSRSWVG